MTIDNMTLFYEETSKKLKDATLGFHFINLVFSDKAPLTKAMKDSLCDIAERYYSDFEIIGETEADFLFSLQLYLDINIDTIERLLEVYNDDIAKPILGRSEVVTYDLKNDNQSTNQNSATTIDNNTTENIDVPIDNVSDDKPTSRVKTNDTGTNSGSGSANVNATQKGTVTTELSDLGVRPNYESLNGFLDNNRTAQIVFINFFKDCFTIRECLTW